MYDKTVIFGNKDNESKIARRLKEKDLVFYHVISTQRTDLFELISLTCV